MSAANCPFPGTTPSISPYGLAGGILWAVENANPAALHAYDASDLARELITATKPRRVAINSALETSSSRR
jgi:hypothetical protein